MVALPNPTIDAIYQTYEQRRAKELRRGYLGGSEIGEECERRLWYSFRWAWQEPIEGRILRLFDTGKREEERLIADLRASGIEVSNIDPDTNEQWRYQDCDGHFSIGLDGVIHGLKESNKWHVLECKTHNKKSFDDLEKKGVLLSKPTHYIQCQVGMGQAGLERALYLAQCKDDDRLYAERIRLDRDTYKSTMLKAKRIIEAESTPDRLSQDPSFYKCRFCPFSSICHDKGQPEVNCRTCVHSTPIKHGQWSCAVDGPCPAACTMHLFIPSILHWAEPIGGDPTWVHYRLPDGREFINCADIGFPAIDAPHYSSDEISAVQTAAIGNPAVEAARQILGGRISTP
jgi:hypothetical protein